MLLPSPSPAGCSCLVLKSPSALCPCVQDELASAGLMFSQQKQTASLAPRTDSAFDAAAAAGPLAASVLGGPLLAGQYQPHAHHPGAASPTALGAAAAAVAAVGAGTSDAPMREAPMQSAPMQSAPFSVQPLGSQAGAASRLPVAVPDKIATFSQQVLMWEEQ